MNQDQIKITVLDDGTLKVETDQISSPNHMNADELLKFVSRLLGGEENRVRKLASQTHSHTHLKQ